MLIFLSQAYFILYAIAVHYYRKLQKLQKKPHKIYFSRLYKKERKKYYANLYHNYITNSREIWKAVKPFLSDKGKSQQNIIIVKNEEINSEEKEVAEEVNAFFHNSLD